MVRDIFAECGEINQVRFACNEDGSFRGFGHVQFTTEEATDDAVKMVGSDVNGKPLRVESPGNKDRDGGRGFINKNRGGIVSPSSKKTTFDE